MNNFGCLKPFNDLYTSPTSPVSVSPKRGLLVKIIKLIYLLMS